MRTTTSLIAGLLLLSALPAAAQPIEADPSWQAPPQDAPPPADPGDDWQARRAYVGLRGSYAFNANAVMTWTPTAPPTAIRASYASGGGNSYARQKRWDLAYSFIGGLAVPLSDSSRLTAMYRWLQVRNAGHKCAVGGSLQSVCLDNNVNSSAVDLGYEMDL